MSWRPDRLVIGIVLITLGIVLAGWFIGHGFAVGRSGERYVTVKGVSERGADADLALWPLSHVATDDDLARAQATIEADARRIHAFLVRQGLDTSQARIQSLEVTDKLADPYRTGPIRRANQGVFVILPRDQAPGPSEENQLNKTIRVVSTVEYYLA